MRVATGKFNFSTVAGTAHLQPQIDSLSPKVHCFGHRYVHIDTRFIFGFQLSSTQLILYFLLLFDLFILAIVEWICDSMDVDT